MTINKGFSLLMGLFLTACSAGNNPLSILGDSKSVEQAKIENITFDAAKKASQTAAEVFDIGTVPVNGTITKTFTLSNLTTSNITLNFTDLQTQLTTNDRFSVNLATGTPCGTSLKLNKTCSFDISLKYNATGVQDYTQPILTNIVDPASQGGNAEFGKVMFTGSKASDLTSSAPLAGLVKLNTLSDSFIVPQGGNITKRFYLGNIGAGNLKAPTIVAPAGGTIATNACVAGSTIKPNGTCFFDINYAYAAGASATAQIGFTSTDPLVDMTNLKIQLAITMQAAVVPTVSANFTQVGSIADLTSANQTTRIYVTNNGSATENPLLTTIPAPYVIASTSCTTTLKVGKSCFFDLKIDPTLTTNMDSINSSITLGSTSGSVKAGNSSSATTTCKANFSLVNNVCVTSNVTQSCSISHGVGSQSSTNGGVSFSACAPVSCDPNYLPGSGSCSPIACTAQNSNISQAASVSGDLVSGCTLLTCSTGFTAVSGNCVSNSILNPNNISVVSDANGIATLSNGIMISGYYGGIAEKPVLFSMYDINPNGIIPSGKILKMIDNNRSCFVMTDGSAYCKNSGVVFNSGVDRIESVSDFTSCALFTDKTVSCWGSTTYGLGDGTLNSSPTTPVSVLGATDVIKLSVSPYGGCALRSNHTLKCWGYEVYPGTTATLEGYTNVVDVAAGVNESRCAAFSDGTAKCIGWDFGQYAQVAAENNIKKVLPIYNGTICLLKNDNTAKCFLGNPQSTAYPQTTLNLTNVMDASVSGISQVFIKYNDGTASVVNWTGVFPGATVYKMNNSNEYRLISTNQIVTPPSKPIIAKTQGIDTGAIIDFIPPANSGSGSQVLQYSVYINSKLSNNASIDLINNRITITGLENFTATSIQIVAKNSDSVETASDFIQVYASPAFDAPTNVSIDSSGIVTLTDPIMPALMYLDGYNVYIKDNNSANDFVLCGKFGSYIDNVTPSLPFNLLIDAGCKYSTDQNGNTIIVDGGSYTVKLKGSTWFGAESSQFSNDATFNYVAPAVLPAEAPSISNVIMDINGYTTFNLSLGNMNGNTLDRYQVKFYNSNTGDLVQNLNLYAGDAFETNLDPSLTYDIYVWVHYFDAQGNGNWTPESNWIYGVTAQ